ncbi:MAG: ABC transporter permease [Treponema sp.]|nr:ABC transporter permease [Treponema sp.]
MITPRRILRRSEPWVLAAILVLGVIVQARSGQFLTGNNLVDLARAIIVPGLFSIGCMMVIVSGGIDVSFTAIASLAMYVTDKTLLASNYSGNVLLAYSMSAGLGLLMGALNGLLIGFLRLPTLVVTLGTASLFTGVMYGVFSASASDVPPSIAAHGKEILFTAVNPQSGLSSNMPSQILILLGILLLVFLLLRYTMLGRGIYAIGGDEAAAERAGFNVPFIKLFLYSFVGLLAGITGILRISMIAYADPSTMLGMELTVIAAVVLGGTRVTGGVGTLTGSILGVALMTILANSLILMGIPTYWTRAFTGIVIIVGTGVTARQIGARQRGGRKKGAARRIDRSTAAKA